MNRTLLLENLPDLLEDLDARLTALEAAKPQAQPVKISYVEHLAAEVKRLTALENNKPNERDWEAAANSALAQLTFSRKNVNWLRDTLDTSQNEVERLKTELDDLTAAATGLADDVIRLTAERNALAAQLDDLRNVNAELREGNAELRKHYTNKNDLCAALQKQNVTLWDDNARLRKDNERQNELIAVLRQNSADLVESMKYLLSEAEPNKERMTALKSLQDENATLRSRLAATSHQTDEIKRLEAVCDDLSDKLDAANEKIAALR